MKSRGEDALGAIRRGRARSQRLARATGAYGFLLLLILISLGFQLGASDTSGARLVTIVLQSATMLVALVVSAAHPWVFRAAIAASLLAILGTAGVLIDSGALGEDAGRSVALLLVAVAPASIAVGVVRDIRAVRRVTVRAMFGVLCIYLLLGMLFAFVYGVIASFQEASFFAQAANESQSDFLYFSFATITTTGYGDLTAATHLGRSLAVSEALIGQIYLVTVVALVVSNLARPRRQADA